MNEEDIQQVKEIINQRLLEYHEAHPSSLSENYILERFSNSDAKLDKLSADLSDLKQDMAVTKTELKGEITALDYKLTGQIESLDHKLTGQIESLDHKLTGQIDTLRSDFNALDHKLTGQISTLNAKFDAKISTTNKIAAGLFILLAIQVVMAGLNMFIR
jgi:outer membrane murein-binding lipoprotein Lpp